MLKTIRDMLLGAFVAGMVSAAFALTGTPPGTGPQLVDGQWLNGLAGGTNLAYQSGIIAAGTTHATSTQLPANIALIEVDTATASTTGVSLPPCIAGTQLTLVNNSGQTLTVFPSIANNPLTAAQDTVNGATSITLANNTSTSPACAKNGVWGAS